MTEACRKSRTSEWIARTKGAIVLSKWSAVSNEASRLAVSTTWRKAWYQVHGAVASVELWPTLLRFDHLFLRLGLRLLRFQRFLLFLFLLRSRNFIFWIGTLRVFSNYWILLNFLSRLFTMVEVRFSDSINVTFDLGLYKTSTTGLRLFTTLNR